MSVVDDVTRAVREEGLHDHVAPATGPSAEVRGNRAKRVEPADSEEPDAR